MIEAPIHAGTVDTPTTGSIDEVLDGCCNLNKSALVQFLHGFDVSGGKFTSEVAILAVHLAVASISGVFYEVHFR